nr:50S ribosomal protein L40e [Candidatus Sigynarchaeota archaeon]
MPIGDVTIRKIAQYHLLYKKVCRKCGALNPFTATKCRHCHSTRLRQKKRETKK